MKFRRKKKSDVAPVEPTGADAPPPDAASAEEGFELDDAARSDEGIEIEVVDSDHVINLTDPDVSPVDARRLMLHVDGRPYHHTAEDGAGAWIYRRDR